MALDRPFLHLGFNLFNSVLLLLPIRVYFLQQSEGLNRIARDNIFGDPDRILNALIED